MENRLGPVTHEIVVGEGDKQPCYRIYEVEPGSLEAAQRLVGELRDAGGWVAPLFCSSWPLHTVGPVIVPRVPWIQIRTAVEDALFDLEANLVEPLRERGLISVDFADYATALARGGEINFWHAETPDVSAMASLISAEFVSMAPGASRIVSVLLHARVPRNFQLRDFDPIGVALEACMSGIWGEDCMVVPSIGREDREGIRVSVMTLQGIGYESGV